MQQEEVSALFGKTYSSELILNKHLKYSVNAVNEISDLEHFSLRYLILLFKMSLLYDHILEVQRLRTAEITVTESTVWQYLSV